MDFPGNMTVGALVRERALQHPERTYLVFEGANGALGGLTYGELDSQTNAIANELISAGLRKGDRALVMLRNSIEFVLAVMAGAKAGIVTVPVNTASVRSDLRHVLDLVEPRAVIYHTEYASLATSEAANRSTVSVSVVVGASPDLVGASPDLNDGTGHIAWPELLSGSVHP